MQHISEFRGVPLIYLLFETARFFYSKECRKEVTDTDMKPDFGLNWAEHCKHNTV
jgi:hypothetical protein